MSAPQNFLARPLTWTLAGLMAAQAILGLVRSDLYRDPPWIAATWFGNDWTTLLLAIPLLLTAHIASTRGSVRARLVRLGVLGYSVYNYAFYLFGAALNEFFPLFVACFVVANAALIQAISLTDARAIAESFRSRTPAKAVGLAMGLVAAGLTGVWMVLWGSYAFGGRVLPVEPEAFKVVAALDLTVMVPLLCIGGLLLWRRHPWGFVIAPMAGIQAAMYLLVLIVNSVVAIRRELVAAPGELPIWGPLAVAMTAMVLVLLAHQRQGVRLETHS
jgi:hypothetical protein